MKKVKNNAGEKLSEDELKLKKEKTYDNVLATIVIKIPELVIPFVNEIFNENFTDNARVIIKNSKHVFNPGGRSLSRRETDAFLELSELLIQKFYHFECETWFDENIILRVAEYDSTLAFENIQKTDSGVLLEYPNSAIIFLRPNNSIPKYMTITHRGPGGEEMSYKVPTVQIRDYTVDDIFEKKLLILLPFYLFIFANQFRRIENDETGIQKIVEVLIDISRRLDDLHRKNEIGEYQKKLILELMQRVSEKLTLKFRNIKEGVDSVMRGEVIRTQADEILEQGEKKGKRNTAGLINFLLTHGRNDDAIRATSDENYLNQLLKDYSSGMLKAE